MSEFINTIDLLGDDVVLGSLIDGTITEFKDNTLTSIRKYGFNKCLLLKTVVLTNVINTENYVFSECTSLETVDLSSITKTKSMPLWHCFRRKRLQWPIMWNT